MEGELSVDLHKGAEHNGAKRRRTPPAATRQAAYHSAAAARLHLPLLPAERSPYTYVLLRIYAQWSFLAFCSNVTV